MRMLGVTLAAALIGNACGGSLPSSSDLSTTETESTTETASVSASRQRGPCVVKDVVLDVVEGPSRSSYRVTAQYIMPARSERCAAPAWSADTRALQITPTASPFEVIVTASKQDFEGTVHAQAPTGARASVTLRF